MWMRELRGGMEMEEVTNGRYTEWMMWRINEMFSFCVTYVINK